MMESRITIAELAKLASALTLADFALQPYAESASSYERQRLESVRDELAQASALIMQITNRATRL